MSIFEGMLGVAAVVFLLIFALCLVAGVGWLLEQVIRPRWWERKRQRRIYDSLTLPRER